MRNHESLQRLAGCLCASVALTLSFVSAARAEVKVSEQPGVIVVTTDRYALHLRKSPLRLTVERHNKLVLATGRAAGSLVLHGETVPFKDIAKFTQKGDELFMDVTTGRDDIIVSYRLKLEPEQVRVEARVVGVDRVDRIGEAFLLGNSGHWYGGAVDQAHNWPLEAHSWSADPMLATSNQAAPFWMASSGVGIFADTYDDLAASLNKDNDGLLRIAYLHSPEMHYTIFVGENIAEVRDLYVGTVGKPRKRPPDIVFERPGWGTWCQYFTKVTQRDVLDYARQIHDGGWPASLVIVDDGWQTHYGDNVFNSKFPDPKAMADEVDLLGYKLVLWVENFANLDSERYRHGKEKGGLIRDAASGEPAHIRWWNGEAGLLDLNDRAVREGYVEELKALMRRYGVGGYKFDGGDAEYWPAAGAISAGGPVTRNRYADLWAEVGSEFELNEQRIGWRVQPLGLFSRMRDKSATWNPADGLPAIVTHGGIQSLLGHVFNCPDLIGGGLDEGFKPDEELNVRWTEAAAFMPIMQFSYAPWQFSEPAQKIIHRFALLHGKLWRSHLKALVERTMATGKPVWSPLFYVFPEDEKTYLIRDEFIVGDRLLVAPVLGPGVRARDVYLPAGQWRDFWSEKIVEGGRTIPNCPAPLESIPVFERL